MNSIKTYWSSRLPPYGAFDDFVIIESVEAGDRLVIRPEEFDFIALHLFNNWKKKKSKYIQILKEWNECIGFNGEENIASKLNDVNTTIKALKLIEGVKESEFGKLLQKDLEIIIAFFERNLNNDVIIRKN